jgi:ankyrin repeat protein
MLAILMGATGLSAEPPAPPVRLAAPRIREWRIDLRDAVAQGDVARLRKILDSDPALVRDGFRPANGAQRGKGRPWVQGFTVLHVAVHAGQLAIVTELLDRGADVNAGIVGSQPGEGSTTPLHIAVSIDSEPMIELLLERGANLEALDSQDDSPLRAALLAERQKTARLLVQHGAEQDVYCAAGLGNEVLLERLIRTDPECAHRSLENGSTPLHFAAANGQVEAARMLLAAGAPINAQERPDLYGSGPTPLQRACLRGHLAVCRLLVDAGADVNMAGSLGPSLHRAVIKGDLEMAQSLIRGGANLRAFDRQGQMALHVATRRGALAMVNLLLDYGADINAESGPNRLPNSDYRMGSETPLDLAVESRRAEIAEFLVSRGAHLGIESPDKLAALLQNRASNSPQ